MIDVSEATRARVGTGVSSEEAFHSKGRCRVERSGKCFMGACSRRVGPDRSIPHGNRTFKSSSKSNIDHYASSTNGL